MEHICRIARIISRPGGNALLVGVGGSGKQSMSRLAAFLCGYEVKQLAVTSKFSVDDLKESLVDMFVRAGIKGNGITFLMTDSQIVNDRFLVCVAGSASGEGCGRVSCRGVAGKEVHAVPR